METKTDQQVESCGKCIYWKATADDKGSCRRQPPQAISFEVDDEVKFETLFPTTSSEDWCGEFKAN